MPSLEGYSEVDRPCMLKQTGDYDVEKDVDGLNRAHRLGGAVAPHIGQGSDRMLVNPSLPLSENRRLRVHHCGHFVICLYIQLPT